MSALPPAKTSSQNRGILSYDLHPSIDHTTLQAAKFSGGNPTQRHQPLRAVQSHGEDYARLKDRVENAKRLKRKNAELEELVADAPQNHGVRGHRGKGQKRARVSSDSDKPPINRQELKELRISLEEFNRSEAEGQIFLKDQMRRLDDDIRRLNQKLEDVVDYLAKVTGARVPPPLRYLLDMGRMKIVQSLSLSSWEELAAGRDSDPLSLARDMHDRLTGVSNSPSLSTLRFLCSYCGARLRNVRVNTVTPEEARDAVKSTPLDSYDRFFVEEIFLFVFGVAL